MTAPLTPKEPDRIADAEGVMEHAPLVYALVHALDRRITGSMSFREPSGAAHTVTFFEGAPVRVEPGSDADRIGEDLVAMDLLSEEALADALLRARSSRRRIGELLVAASAVEADMFVDTLKLQTARRLALLANLPPSSTFALYFSARAEPEPLSPWAPLDMLLATIRAWTDRSRLHGTLRWLADKPLLLAEAGRIRDLMLTSREQDAVAVMSRETVALKALYATVGKGLSSLLYMLAVTRQFAFMADKGPPMGRRKTSDLVREAVQVAVPIAPTIASIADQERAAPTDDRVFRGSVAPPAHERPAPEPAFALPLPLPPHVADLRPAPSAFALPPEPPSPPAPPPAPPLAPPLASPPAPPDHATPPGAAGSGPQGAGAGAMGATSASVAPPGPPRRRVSIPVGPDSQRPAAPTVPVRVPPPPPSVARPAPMEVPGSPSPPSPPLSPPAPLRPSASPPKFVDPGRPPTRIPEQAMMPSSALMSDEFRRAENASRALDFETAERILLERCSEADAAEPDYQALAAWVKANLHPDDFTSSLNDLTFLLMAHAGCESALYYRGLLLKRSGKEKAALRDFVILAKLNPGHPGALTEIKALRDKRG